MGLWATWSSKGCPCPWQRGWARWSLKVSPNPKHFMILWFQISCFLRSGLLTCWRCSLWLYGPEKWVLNVWLLIAPQITPRVLEILRRIKTENKKLFLLKSSKVLVNCPKKRENIANAINVFLICCDVARALASQSLSEHLNLQFLLKTDHCHGIINQISPRHQA